LRLRAEDILVLAEHFAIGMVKELGHEFFAGFSETVQRQLLAYSWPGNIRELKNVVERAVYQHPQRTITRLVFNPFESPYRPGAAVTRIAVEEDVADSAAPAFENMLPAAPVLNGSGIDFREHIQNYEQE